VRNHRVAGTVQSDMGRHDWLRRWPTLALGLVLVIPALSSCASGGPGTQSANAGASTTAGTNPTTPAPQSSTGGPGGTGTGDEENPGDMTDPQLPGTPKTLRGTADAGVEANCVLLNADDGKSYLLLGGDREVIMSGARIEVAGKVMPDLMTTCQQGIPFTVTTVRKI
jgi:hypothetical protein